MKGKSLLSTGVVVIALIVFGKLIAFAKDILISAYFGASLETDSFFIALNITSILFVAFSSTVSVVFLPLYNEQKVRHNYQVASMYSSNAISIYIAISFAISLIGFTFATEIVEALSSTANKQRVLLSANLLKIMVVSFVFSVFTSFLISIQLSNKQYLFPHLIPIINNSIVFIAVLIFASSYGIYVAAIAGVLAWVIQVPLHLWFVRKEFRYSFYLNVNDETIKKMGVLFLPAFLGIFVDQINILVDTVLASDLSEGSISALNYSNRLISFASGIFIMAIMSIMFPVFSEYIEKKDSLNLNKAIRSSLRVLLIVLVMITSIVVVFYNEIVSIVFERGKFDNMAVENTSSVFLFYGVGLVFIGLRELFNKIFYAKKDTKTPLWISVISVSTNIALSLLLVDSMGINGLALASSLSIMLYVSIQLFMLNKLIGAEFYAGIPTLLLKLLLATLLSLFSMIFFKSAYTFDYPMLGFICAVSIGIFVYIVALYFLKTDEVIFIKNKLLRLAG